MQQERLPSMRMLRRKSAWADAAFVAEGMRSLGRALVPWTVDFRSVLLMDCHLIAFAAPVLCAAGAAGIWELPLSAKMTWLMQPLDTRACSQSSRRRSGGGMSRRRRRRRPGK